MSNLIDQLVPKGPPDLCFESWAFTKESFSVDQFLQDHRTGSNLETMRDDLGIYLKVLRSAMIDLINKDYADYVNLSSNLIGLDRAIGNINAPLGQLKEELMQVNQLINNAISEVTEKLEQKKALRERKRSLKCLSRVRFHLRKLQMLLSSGGGQVIDSSSSVSILTPQTLDVEVVERAVTEFSQLQFNSDKCFHLMSHQERQMYQEIGEVLYKNVNKLLIDAINRGESGRDELARCLVYYLNMNKQNNVERFYRTSVVQPAMEPLITKENLKSFARGLPALYEKIIFYIDNDMKYLLQVTADDSRYPGLNIYEFLLRSFWPEVEQRLEINLASIYDAGDPNTFYQRYNETVRFIDEFSKRLKDDKSRAEWRRSDTFSSFINKWNIAVYFQIRFQEIVKGVESRLVNTVEECEETSSGGEWKLRATETAWESVVKCWSPGVFIKAIADKFWKLSLQILSRYHVWIRQILTQQQKGPLMKGGESENCTKFLVLLYSDVKALVDKLPQIRELAFDHLSDISPSTRTSLTNSLDESGAELLKETAGIEEGIVKSLVSLCSIHLRQVSDIPRLYRRTNRESPTKPCPYLTSLLKPPTDFHRRHSQIPASTVWLHTLFSHLTKQYYKLVSEVLTSVQKTEESLRRLKKARDNRNQTLPSQQLRTADDDKIRLQLMIDVTTYANAMDSLGIKKNSVEQLTDLLLLVETTQKL